MNFFWLIVSGVALMAGTVWLVTSWERRRARVLRQAGTALGLRAFEKGAPLLVPSVEIMRKRRRTIGAALDGTWKGAPITVFDLSYPAGKDVCRTTVFMLRLPEPRIPEFAAIRKDIMLYTPTVDLPNVEAVPATLKWHWLLYAPGARWPFGEELTQWLARNKRWSIEGRGSGLFLYQRGQRTPAKKLESWLNEAFDESKEILSRISDDGGCSQWTTIDDQEVSSQKQVFTFKGSLRI